MSASASPPSLLHSSLGPATVCICVQTSALALSQDSTDAVCSPNRSVPAAVTVTDVAADVVDVVADDDTTPDVTAAAARSSGRRAVGRPRPRAGAQEGEHATAGAVQRARA